MSKPFHLAWFVHGFRPPNWVGDRAFSGAAERDWAKPDFWVDWAKALERACFDFMLIANASFMADTYEGSFRVPLKYGAGGAAHETAALLPILGYATNRLGFAATLTTTEWYPFQLARFMGTFDNLSGGRAAWNIVTGSNDRAAQNYGHDKQPPHDERYDSADEYVDLVQKLWASWDPDAVVADEESGVWADHTKVRTVDFVGQYYKCRGPGLTIPSPQGRPIIVQAGGSGRGREYATRWADVIISPGGPIARLRAFRDDVTARLIKHGRNPADCKVIFLCSPVVKATDAEAKLEAERLAALEHAQPEKLVAVIASLVGVDLSKYDLDKPLPSDLHTNGHQQLLDQLVGSGLPLRQAVAAQTDPGNLIGAPDTVAKLMEELVDQTGADGLMIMREGVTREYITEITDGLVPALQRRGLTRTRYTGETLRDHLFEF